MIPATKMTKAERSELGQLVRKRERVMKSMAEERAAQLLADFERQAAAIYSFDDDKTWQKAHNEAKSAVEAANLDIAKRCEKLGIPKQFAPSIQMQWWDRGQNGVAKRRAELRNVAKTRIKAVVAEIERKIERMSLEAQTEIIANGLESEAAKAFLQNMPTIDEMMPSLDAKQIKQLVDAEHEGEEGDNDDD